MTQDEKAQVYDNLIRRGDVVQREISKLKSTNIGGESTEDLAKIAVLEAEMIQLNNKMNQLMNS